MEEVSAHAAPIAEAVSLPPGATSSLVESHDAGHVVVHLLALLARRHDRRNGFLCFRVTIPARAEYVRHATTKATPTNHLRQVCRKSARAAQPGSPTTIRRTSDATADATRQNIFGVIRTTTNQRAGPRVRVQKIGPRVDLGPAYTRVRLQINSCASN